MDDSSNENGKTAALAAEFLRKSVEDAVNSAMEDQFASFFEDCASGAESPRNGYYERKIITMAGVINARMPRDRLGMHSLWNGRPKRNKRISGLYEMIDAELETLGMER